MALTYSWNTVNATQTDADSPLDTTLMEAIRQNLIHLEEWLGKSYTAGEDHDHDGTNSKLVTSVADNAITPAKLSAQTAGDFFLSSNDTVRSSTSGIYELLKEIKIAKSGQYRIKFYLASITAGTAYGRIYKNGSAVGTERSTASSATYSEDLSGFAAGDLIQVYGKHGGGGSAEISNFRIYGATPGDFGINPSY